jgi:hypothetical protein
MTFDAELLELMPDTLVATPGALDGFGQWAASGEVLSLACYISGRNRQTRDLAGREVVSTVQVTVGGAYGLTVEGYRYGLPDRFEPNSGLTAISVRRASDEDGAHHEVVMLP